MQMIRKHSHISFLITKLKCIYIHRENALRQRAGINSIFTLTILANLIHYSFVEEATLEADSPSWSRNCPHFTEPEGLLPYSNGHATTPYLHPDKPVDKRSVSFFFFFFFCSRPPSELDLTMRPPPHSSQNLLLTKKRYFVSYC